MRAIRYEESLQSRFPEIASEWCSYKNDGLLPINVTPGSNKKVWWICSKGHEYLAMVAKRTTVFWWMRAITFWTEDVRCTALSLEKRAFWS